MAVDKTKDIQVGGTLHSIATGNIIAHADEVMDEDYGKKQSEINQELSSRLTEELKDYLPLTGGTLTGNLTAPIFIGDLQGTATKATQDASGNVITTTYATKTEVTNISNSIPTKVSQLTNDSNYQTESQVEAKVASLVDSAPETLDTLNELAAALGDDPNFATTITAQIGQKADIVHTHNVADISGLSDVATSGDYNDLSNTPTIPTYSEVTTTKNGLMTSTDKSRLDTIYQQLTDLDGVSHIADDQAFTQSEGNLVFNFSCIKPTDAENNKVIHSVAIPTATTEAAGVMAAEDKTKLDTIQQQLTVKSTITWIELD